MYIAYDRDDAGEKAATKHAEELMAIGIECFRVQFPKGQDANEYAWMTQPAAKALGMLLNERGVAGQRQAASYGAEAEPATPASEEERKPEPMKKQEPSAPEEKPNPTAKEKIAIETPTPSIAGESVLSLAAVPESVQQEEAAPEKPMPSVRGPPRRTWKSRSTARDRSRASGRASTAC